VALRRLHLPALLLVLGLMVVGNAYEPRAFGEALVLSWMAISAGLVRWLGEDEPCPPADEPGWLRRLDRTGAMVLLLAFIAVVLALDR
jgi:hypothetical protein